jgi:MFS family permease
MEAGARARLGRIVRVASGNFLEMYDFMVFGYYAAAIGAAFFPAASASLSLLLALATFGAGFLMRPLGAIVLGAYADRHGRRAGLLLTLSLMSVGILLTALTPGYATLGVAAPLVVLGGRLLQGLSAGMELGGVSVYLAEIAPPGAKGFYVSWQSASQQVAVMFAATVGLILSRQLTAAQMTEWGWRVPLLLGCLIIPVVLWLRRSLEETAEFSARTYRPTLAQLLRSLAQSARVVALGMLMVTMTTVSFYMITAYTPTFGTAVLHLKSLDSFLATLAVGASNLLWLPAMGALSDRIGRRPLLLACTVLMLVSAYPVLLWLVGGASLPRLLATELWLSFLYASYNGAMVVCLTEIMPAQLRTTGFALAYSLATSLFGGFTPAICTWLIGQTHNRAVPGLWLSFAALCGLVAAFMVRAPDPGPLRHKTDRLPSSPGR